MPRIFRVVVNGQAYQVEVEEISESALAHGSSVVDEVWGREEGNREVRAALTQTAPPGGEQVVAPLPGVVLEVKVVEGEQVEAGQVLLVLEAMKMENEVVAPCPGKVAGIRVEAGMVVNVGDLLMVLGS